MVERIFKGMIIGSIAALVTLLWMHFARAQDREHPDFAIVVTLCFAVTTCHEEIAIIQPMPMCFVSPADVALWKEQSTFSGPQWTIGRVRCEPADYQPKEAI